jgi:hypothetical protein
MKRLPAAFAVTGALPMSAPAMAEEYPLLSIATILGRQLCVKEFCAQDFGLAGGPFYQGFGEFSG